MVEQMLDFIVTFEIDFGRAGGGGGVEQLWYFLGSKSHIIAQNPRFYRLDLRRNIKTKTGFRVRGPGEGF